MLPCRRIVLVVRLYPRISARKDHALEVHTFAQSLAMDSFFPEIVIVVKCALVEFDGVIRSKFSRFLQ